MPRQAKGPRLWKRPGSDGRSPHWVVLDAGKKISTGVVARVTESRPPQEAQEFLASYISSKYSPERKLRDIDRILMTDVLGVYYEDRLEAFETELHQRRFGSTILRLNSFFGKKYLGDINQALTNGYVKKRGTPGGARRDLEVLRAAINHHAAQNLHHAVINVKLPPKGSPRERWLTRDEAAKLIWAAWTHREEQTIHRGKNKGVLIKTAKYTLRHIARFILIGLYTGTRAAAVASASPYQKEGHSYVDLDAGRFYRLAIGKRVTNKRQPPVPLPDRLLAHMRRWVDRKLVANHFVEWHGKGVKEVKNGFARAVEMAGLDTVSVGNVTPHTLRHTAATWLMIQGAEPWAAAGYLGMSVKTLIDTYGHHHPDYMKDAAAAITAKRTPAKRTISPRPKVPQLTRRDR
jgi:integrase